MQSNRKDNSYEKSRHFSREQFFLSHCGPRRSLRAAGFLAPPPRPRRGLCSSARPASARERAALAPGAQNFPSFLRSACGLLRPPPPRATPPGPCEGFVRAL